MLHSHVTCNFIWMNMWIFYNANNTVDTCDTRTDNLLSYQGSYESSLWNYEVHLILNSFDNPKALVCIHLCAIVYMQYVCMYVLVHACAHSCTCNCAVVCVHVFSYTHGYWCTKLCVGKLFMITLNLVHLKGIHQYWCISLRGNWPCGGGSTTSCGPGSSTLFWVGFVYHG